MNVELYCLFLFFLLLLHIDFRIIKMGLTKICIFGEGQVPWGEGGGDVTFWGKYLHTPNLS